MGHSNGWNWFLRRGRFSIHSGISPLCAGVGPVEKAAFVAGAFVASLSWQLLLAAVGAFLHRRLSPGLRAGVIVLGNTIVLLFALVIAIDLVA